MIVLYLSGDRMEIRAFEMTFCNIDFYNQDSLDHNIFFCQFDFLQNELFHNGMKTRR